MYHQEIAIICVAAAVFAGFAYLCGKLLWQKKRGTVTKRSIYHVISGGAICLSFALWYFNVGMIRFLLALPMLFYAVFLFLMMHIAAPYGEKNPKLLFWMRLVLLTFVLSHLFMPDTDFNSVYALCNLIENPPMIIGCFIITACVAVIHTVLLIRMISLWLKEKKYAQ